MSTGGSLASLYDKARAEAAQAAIERNKFFQRATEAYISGNKKAAKTFSEEGRRLNKIVEEANMEAANYIFQARNSNRPTIGAGVASKGGGSEHLLDLHGLHPNEAAYYLNAALEDLRKLHFRGMLSVVTGTGHHSQGGQGAKLLPLVKQQLKAGGYSFREASLEDGKGGLFIVYLG
jgi:DNA-nicking Smr family endonuclease